ncbi:MAG: SusC/RagA family TonB-linked outer membrane protein [Saprospiraceae bacterium]|nr:SusC/RagA family TonB-linked outer membrane protein [Saprospiraceae bacterium]
MKRLLTTIWLVLAVVGFALAQRTVVGTVKGDDGEPLIGATVSVKGTTGGGRTDIEGKYSVLVPAGSSVLVFSYTGYQSQEITLGASNVVDLVLAGGIQLGETVVTALGVSRYKNELPYSAQKVGGEDVSNVRNQNVVNSLSGKVAGLEIRRNNNLGGSTNIVLRGTKSLTNDNQALFVVDGVPIDNSNTNEADQRRGRLGYDYGNAASDINSDDIESVTVLKGAAASALYGSRASNGVVMITTKKGTKKKGIGISVNSGMNFGNYDKSTFVDIQDKYGAGYGQFYEDPSGYFLYRDIDENGTEDLVVTTSEDASWGPAFDPNLQVYQWDAFDVSSPNYGKARPWVAATNGPSSIFETAVGISNSIMIDGSTEKGYFKLGYTKNTDKGIMPNSNIDKDLINFGASYNLTDKLNFSASINYTSTDGLGRYGTGYDSKNLMGNFRQWWQTNVDVQEMRAAYERTKQNITWNWADPTDLAPIYWDNPYWTRFENYQNDHRNRYFGNIALNYKLTSWLNLMGRVSLDQYDEIQEERIALGSIDVSEYSRFNRNFREMNYDLLLEVPQMSITDALKFDALIGGNVRRTDISSIRAQTNGGLALPRLYALSNSKNDLQAPAEAASQLEVDGIFGKVGFVYNRWAILDLTIRRDRASSLPEGNNSYIYPSASLGVIFSEFLGDNSFISFGKARVNYASVSNTAPPLSVYDVYNVNTPFGDASNISLPVTKNNSDLKPEFTNSLEAGLEMRFAKDRFGFDVTVYQTKTYDQIIPVAVSRATGYSAKFLNIGEVQNKGVELSAFLRPVHTRDLSWRVELNWARNRNEVVDLGGSIDNLQLSSSQGGVSVNATLGQAYGTIRGNNFVYNDKGEKVVGPNGRYRLSATSNEVIGNVNPDWIGGITNSLRYKNITLGFLIDVKQGGDVFSLDMYYGLATGIPVETAGKNDLGNDLRLPLDQGGGIINPGVKDDGTPNDIRIAATDFGVFGYRRKPAAAFIYDASFVKLREVNLSWDLPSTLLGNNRIFKGVTLGVYGRNLWIIHKNLPYADPEDGLSSGNVQGYQAGSYPTVRTFGANLNLKF